MTRIFKTRWVTRFARRENLADKSLAEAIERAERGIIDADLGGGLIKQRVARTGQGRSGGYRMLVAFRGKERAIFVYGFAKSERENIGAAELAELQEIAKGWLEAGSEQIAQAVGDSSLKEVRVDDQNPA